MDVDGGGTAYRLLTQHRKFPLHRSPQLLSHFFFFSGDQRKILNSLAMGLAAPRKYVRSFELVLFIS